MRQTVPEYIREHGLVTAWTHLDIENVARTIKRLKVAGYSAKEVVDGAKLPTVDDTPSTRPFDVGESVRFLHDAGYNILDVSRATGLAMCIAVPSNSGFREREIVGFFQDTSYSNRDIVGEFTRIVGAIYVPEGIERRLIS